MKLILLGAPGAGKGTQAERLCNRLHIPVISTGSILRAAVEQGTELGIAVKTFMESGRLVPDTLVLEIVTERMMRPDCTNGYILDGVPRTVAQAEAIERSGLAEGIQALLIETPDREIEARMVGRRVCAGCSAPYHIEAKPPKANGVCDLCGDSLIIRGDDAPETVRQRLAIYHETTAPLIAFYETRGALHIVRTQPAVDATTELVFQTLGL